MKYANVASALGTLLVGFAAALVAYWTFRYMRAQGTQARADSVRDEYWLRTVVSPTSIEPFQAFISELRRDLLTFDTSSPTVQAADVEALFARATDRFNDFSLKFKSLALIDDALSAEVEGQLQNIEDSFTTYIGSLRLHLTTGSTAPSRSDIIAALTDGMVDLFKLIQMHQVSGSA
ncbi:MAG: hypothetical protein HY856_17775 [Burkholderiales bacterium]|nr:hypothetical protein [Burkholderiales bacterium]